MIVLDTDVLSAVRRSGDSRLHWWLAGLPETPCISIYSVTEIQVGIASVRGRDPDFARQLSSWLDRMLATTDILPFSVTAARLLGEMQAIDGLRPLEGDLVIAAIAIAESCSLATSACVTTA